MAGRLPKPTGLLLLSGAARKNPKRLRERGNEPVSPGPIGKPPAKWKTKSRNAKRAEVLFAEEKSLNEISAALEIEWEEVRDLRDRRKHYKEWSKLRAIWANCIAMWPWITFSDRDALEGYCILKLKEDEGRLSGAELTALMRARTELGGTGSGRARLGIRSTPGASQPKKASDPRSNFMAKRKFG
jgi:hypothetical protein